VLSVAIPLVTGDGTLAVAMVPRAGTTSDHTLDIFPPLEELAVFPLFMSILTVMFSRVFHVFHVSVFFSVRRFAVLV